MREIKFRGKRLDNGTRTYGHLYPHGNRYIIGNQKFWHFVDEDTICQFTGLYDKDGREIYEGDILSTQARDVSFEIVWVQENSSFMFKSNDSLNLWEVDKSVNRLEVIGNIHDNGQTLHTCNEKPCYYVTID